MGWAQTWRTLGPRDFSSYALARAAELLPGLAWHRYRIIAVPRAGVPAMPRGHHVRPLSPDEVVRHAEALDLPEAAQRHRFGQGMVCLAAFRGDRLLGCNWVTDGPFDEDEVPIRFVPPPRAAWDTGLYLCPENRGGRGFAALWAGTGEWLAAHGLDWSLSRITDYNLSSWRAHARMGAVELDRIAALRIGRRQWLFGARPVLLLPDPAVVL